MSEGVNAFEVTDSALEKSTLIVMLALCVTIPAMLRLLFLWYLAFHAPKGRPINILIGIEQVMSLTDVLFLCCHVKRL